MFPASEQLSSWLVTKSAPISESVSLKTDAALRYQQQFPWQQEPDWTTHFAQCYIETLLVSPLLVAETLSGIQLQKRLESGLAEETSAAQTYEAVQGGKESVPLYLPRLGDFISTSKLLIDSEQEGWSANFKGHLTHFAYRSVFTALQPYLEESLNDTFNVFEDVHPLTLAFSHVAVGTLLSPLELVRTRLIAQSLSPHRKKYFGPFHALYTISLEERPTPHAGVLATFYSISNLIPTMILRTISPLVRYASVSFIEHELGLDPSFNPLLYKLAQVALLGVEALLTCPFELARSRLYLQRQGQTQAHSFADADTKAAPLPALPLDTCVETSHQIYSGTLDCLRSVVQTEGGMRPRRKPKNVTLSSDDWQNIYGGAGILKADAAPSWLHSVAGIGMGVSSVFRGFWPRYTALVIQFVSEEVNKDDMW
ncbi:hypothetical protein HDU91_000122 [Kappamyces sp. JEL0680]|nr:hypothetical protein HDU91_000122 [Kappamyces sp. JEL0680]